MPGHHASTNCSDLVPSIFVPLHVGWHTGPSFPAPSPSCVPVSALPATSELLHSPLYEGPHCGSSHRFSSDLAADLISIQECAIESSVPVGSVYYVFAFCVLHGILALLAIQSHNLMPSPFEIVFSVWHTQTMIASCFFSLVPRTGLVCLFHFAAFACSGYRTALDVSLV